VHPVAIPIKLSTLGERTPGNYRIRDWADPRISLDAVKSLVPAMNRTTNPGSSTPQPSLVSFIFRNNSKRVAEEMKQLRPDIASVNAPWNSRSLFSDVWRCLEQQGASFREPQGLAIMSTPQKWMDGVGVTSGQSNRFQLGRTLRGTLDIAGAPRVSWRPTYIDMRAESLNSLTKYRSLLGYTTVNTSRRQWTHDVII
jgi:hypothetical protein